MKLKKLRSKSILFSSFCVSVCVRGHSKKSNKTYTRGGDFIDFQNFDFNSFVCKKPFYKAT